MNWLMLAIIALFVAVVVRHYSAFKHKRMVLSSYFNEARSGDLIFSKPNELMDVPDATPFIVIRKGDSVHICSFDDQLKFVRYTPRQFVFKFPSRIFVRTLDREHLKNINERVEAFVSFAEKHFRKNNLDVLCAEVLKLFAFKSYAFKCSDKFDLMFLLLVKSGIVHERTMRKHIISMRWYLQNICAEDQPRRRQHYSDIVELFPY